MILGGRGFRAVLLAGLALSACAAPEPRAVNEEGTRPRPDAFPRMPDTPDAFRAELRGGQAPGCPLRGQAVHLGGGRFLTAAHLVDGVVPRLRHCTGTPIPTTIRFNGRVLPVRPVRMGQGYVEPGVGPLYRHGEDLALLQASAVPAGPAATPCGAGPMPGQPVLVLASRGRAAVRAGEMVPESRADDGTYADLPLSMVEGESGGGVFDAETKCLLGIISHRPDAKPQHVRIVPASVIRAFLGG
ncbi:trypsin-like peptidase domain-containing protein [Roseomonas sp. SSH11]|uniref:Trypsin-like peptidase domain-containing protein n=1 Tax=Pararoseomonas baculiformis TaxID=2820812 RepID=A0ABS4A8B0_9PROT|nr:trypsin-like peptidase domain-containing protein [Pararoseomonas baculiformis]MBP0443234.1 trypsin-like peptidase domain-containing protein [Pararoseomonas baculiformis]